MEVKAESRVTKNGWLEIYLSRESIISTPNGKQVKGLNSGGRIYRAKPGLFEVKLSNQAIEYDERFFIIVPISDCTINGIKYPKVQKIIFRQTDVFLESLEKPVSIPDNDRKGGEIGTVPPNLPTDGSSKLIEQSQKIDALEKRIEGLSYFLKTKEKENEQLRAENERLKQEIAAIIPLDERKKTREAELIQLQGMIEALERQYEGMDSQKATLELRIKRISESIEQAKKQLDSSNDELIDYYIKLSDRIKELSNSIAEKADDVEKEKEDIDSMRGEEFIDQGALTEIELKYDALNKELTSLQQEMANIRRKATEHGNIRQKKLYDEQS